jgi:replicative DNA helicase
MPVICDISASREAEAQCIVVSHPDRLYITDDYVVTHNTALATNIAFTAARAEGQPKAGDKNPDKRNVVAFFSLEMSAEELATRLLAQEAKVSGHKIRRGEISQKDFNAFAQATQLLSRVPLFIDDTPALSVSVLRTRARRLKRQQGSLALIVVDYLQLLRPSHDARPENRVQEVSDITRMLKALAKELGVPVLALSQLSRQVENREDKRPQLADLRESGSIEQDSDVVMFVYREEYYLERQQPPEGTDKHIKWQEDMARVHNVAEVIVGKQRHGPVGLAKLYFDAAHTRFGNLDTDHPPDGHG